MIWPFKRKPKVVDLRGWNADWQVSDLAVCICDNWPHPDIRNPQREEVLRVSELCEGVDALGSFYISALRFEGFDQRDGWVCTAFRKVRPNAERCDEAFRDLLRKLPVKQRERVS